MHMGNYGYLNLLFSIVKMHAFFSKELVLLTVTSKLAQARAHAIDLHGSVNLEVGLVGLEVKKRFFLVLKFFTYRYQYLPLSLVH